MRFLARLFVNVMRVLQPHLDSLQQRMQIFESRAAEFSTKLNSLENNLNALEKRLSLFDMPVAFRGDFYSRPERPRSADRYWSEHNVTAHKSFASAEESIAYLDYRNKLYPGYIELLPVAGWDDKVILDFGCGPGNDLVGFAHFSHPKRLIGVDVSATSLKEAEDRLRHHNARAELIQISPTTYELPIESASIDYIHCSGVLMHVEDPIQLLKEFRRVLRTTGEARIMVYNYDSVWLHLYVAYIVQIVLGAYHDRDIREAFSRTTDGEYCPFVNVWRHSEMNKMAEEAHFSIEFLGAAVSLWELNALPSRFKALMDPNLGVENRDFLLELRFDDRGLPIYRGHHAGIDACYRLRPED